MKINFECFVFLLFCVLVMMVCVCMVCSNCVLFLVVVMKFLVCRMGWFSVMVIMVWCRDFGFCVVWLCSVKDC